MSLTALKRTCLHFSWLIDNAQFSIQARGNLGENGGRGEPCLAPSSRNITVPVLDFRPLFLCFSGDRNPSSPKWLRTTQPRRLSARCWEARGPARPTEMISIQFRPSELNWQCTLAEMKWWKWYFLWETPCSPDSGILFFPLSSSFLFAALSGRIFLTQKRHQGQVSDGPPGGARLIKTGHWKQKSRTSSTKKVH